MDIIFSPYVQTLLMVIFSVTLICHTDSRTLSASNPTDPYSLETNNVILPNEEEVKEQAMGKLLQVFGLENYTGPNEVGSMATNRPPRPPPFMLNLYNSVADSTSGITRSPNPYNANTVRALQDKALKHRMRFEFNLSRVTSDERLLQAELHLFKLKPKRYTKNDPRFQTHYQIHLYQLLGDADSSTDGARLVGVRLISAARSGWEVFTITDAAQNWLEDESTNHGIFISVTTLTGEPVEDGVIRFAQRGKHHDTKQPILVMFTDDITRKTSPRTRFEEPVDYTYDYILENRGNVDWRQLNSADDSVDSTQNGRQNHYTEDRRRVRRETEHTIPVPVPTENEVKENLCQRQSMYVDFEKIGWSSWVISPKGYNAYHCTGRTCPFLLVSTSRHRTMQRFKA
ncbi:bone morphogenetic protein 2-like [Amphiura filiformis]|uniref:bone morphogenetic protein 2-like n=1 Tax=Amphiura filiformis TaxID=82378 RepID=UPI003B21BDB2